jgi:hypothetical protein
MSVRHIRRGGFLLGVREATRADWSPRPAHLIALYVALYAIVCIPVFSFQVLPLSDLPNHLARFYILDHLDGDLLLQKHYVARWRLFSFQATDIILPSLTHVLGLALGCQIFVAASFASLLAGTIAIHRVLFRHTGLWPAAALLFLYNLSLAGGQISFMFSTGFGLLLFAAWLASARTSSLLRIPVFAVASLLLMFFHFFVFCAYALMVMSFALERARSSARTGEQLRIIVEAGLPFVLPAICFLTSFGGTIAGPSEWGNILRKPVALLSPVMNYGRWPDLVLALAVIIALWWLNRRKAIKLAPDMLLPIATLVLTAIAMPRLLQGVNAADIRLPCILAFLLVASSDLRLGSRRHGLVFIAGIFVLVALRIGSTTLEWKRIDADYREFRAADGALERGSRVAVIPVGHDLRADPAPRLPYWYVACLAVIDRQVFMPLLYTAATPLELTEEGKALNGDELAHGRKVPEWHPADPAFAGIDPQTLRQVQIAAQRMSDDDAFTSRIDWSDWPERFDYLIDFHMGRAGNPVPALLSEVRRGSYFTIYRIHPPL